MEKYMDKIALLVNSCDKYEDLWAPFFTLLKKYWNPEYPIVLNTESKDFNFEGLNIKTLKLFENKNVEWSERLRITLENIDSEYVITLLDDFFLEKSVDNNKINQCVKWMDENQNIAAFYFVYNILGF